MVFVGDFSLDERREHVDGLIATLNKCPGIEVRLNDRRDPGRSEAEALGDLERSRWAKKAAEEKNL